MNSYTTVRDIAKLAGVRPVTVRAWRTRFGDFPVPIDVIAGTPIFDPAQVQEWLRKHGRIAA